MTKVEKIKHDIRKDFESFWSWSLELWTREQIVNGEIDAPSYPDWNRIEQNLERAFAHLNFDKVEDDFLDQLIFIIAQQWDIGIVLNWFNKGKEEIGQLGMTEFQFEKLCERGLTSNLSDAKSQFAASLYKIENKEKAVELLLIYYEDENEYIRRLSLKSLSKLNYSGLNELLIKSWANDEEYERMMCLEIWNHTNEKDFDKYSELAIRDSRKYLHEFATKLKNPN